MKISKEELEQKYHSMENIALAKELGITKATLITYLKKAGIQLKGKGNRNKRPKIQIF